MSPEEIELLSDLTIIIPTYNRPLELERSIEYWRDTPVTVHILDGSDKAWFPVGLLSETERIYYHHNPERNSQSVHENYLERIRFGVGLSGTNYSAICADDDFFAIGPLSKSIKILNSHDLVDAIIGQPILYKKVEQNLAWLYDTFIMAYSEGSHQEVTRRLFSPVQGSLYYGVVRTRLWQEINLHQAAAIFSNPVRNEFLGRFLASTMCRTHVIDEYMWLKNSDTRNAGSLRVPSLKFVEWLNDKNSETEVNNFKKILATCMCLVDKSLPYQSALEFVEARMKAVPKVRDKFKKRVEIGIKRNVLMMLSKLPERLREILFVTLPEDLKIRFGDSAFMHNFTPIQFLDYSTIDSLSARRLENVLLAPRDELRLRANI